MVDEVVKENSMEIFMELEKNLALIKRARKEYPITLVREDRSLVYLSCNRNHR